MSTSVRIIAQHYDNETGKLLKEITVTEVLTKYWICTTIKSRIIKTFLGQNDKS